MLLGKFADSGARGRRIRSSCAVGPVSRFRSGRTYYQAYASKRGGGGFICRAVERQCNRQVELVHGQVRPGVCMRAYLGLGFRF